MYQTNLLLNYRLVPRTMFMDKQGKTLLLKTFAWSLGALVVVVAFMAWAESIRWRVFRVDSYQLFPLFGLLAFSVMWSHYIVSAVRQYLDIAKAELKNYIEITSFLVLAALFLHPGLLVWQLWRDGFGLPPGSYLQNYVSPMLRWAALLGTVSLFIFFAYELRRRYSERQWWSYVRVATDLAMIAVFVHGLKLGRNLQSGWLESVWYVYGVTLLAAMAYTYWLRLRRRQAVKS